MLATEVPPVIRREQEPGCQQLRVVQSRRVPGALESELPGMFPQRGFRTITVGTGSFKEEGAPYRPSNTMIVLWILIPLAVLAIGIAVLPVLIGSKRHDQSVREGEPASTQMAAREVNSWHARLGRRTRRAPGELEPGSDATVHTSRRSRTRRSAPTGGTTSK